MIDIRFEHGGSRAFARSIRPPERSSFEPKRTFATVPKSNNEDNFVRLANWGIPWPRYFGPLNGVANPPSPLLRSLCAQQHSDVRNPGQLATLHPYDIKIMASGMYGAPNRNRLGKRSRLCQLYKKRQPKLRGSRLMPERGKPVLLISLLPRIRSSAFVLLIPVFLIATMLVTALNSHSAFAQAVVAPSCPQGYVLSGNNCVAGAPVPTCPRGYTFSNGQCTAVVRSSPSSPSGPSAGPWVFMVQKNLGLQSANELNGAAICTVRGSLSVPALNAFFQNNGMTYEPVLASSGGDARDKYLSNACDVIIADERSSAPALRSLTPAGAHMILPERLVGVGSAPIARPSLPSASPTPVRPVDLAVPLQSELKRIGCLGGRVDGVWGKGSRAALRKFAQRAGLNLGSQPSQNALNEARRRQPGFCPARVTPKRQKKAKRNRCGSGSVFLEGQCIPKSEVASYCGPGYTRSGTKCVQMGSSNPAPTQKVFRCNNKDYAFCKPRAQEYCEGDGSNSCLNRETKMCLREEIGCKP